MKMQNLGRKESLVYGGPMDVSPGKKKEDPIIYPSFHFSNPPDFLMDKDVGHKCRLEIVIEIKSKSIDENRGGKKRESVSADILQMGYKSKAGSLSKEEYQKLSQAEKDAYDQEEVNSR